MFYHFNWETKIYVKLENGQVCQPPASMPITSEQDCIAAATSLGLHWKVSWNGINDFPGCLFADDGRSKVYFNLSPYPATSNLNPNYAGICVKSNDKSNLPFCYFSARRVCHEWPPIPLKWEKIIMDYPSSPSHRTRWIVWANKKRTLEKQIKKVGSEKMTSLGGDLPVGYFVTYVMGEFA